MMPVVLFVAGLTGFSISLYFALVFYGRIGTDTAFIPFFCRMEDNACQRVLHHAAARVFSVPNFLPGMAYYILVMMFASGVCFSHFGTALMVAAWLTVLLACYLVYSLFFVLKISCPLCLVSHAMNILIAAILTLGEQPCR